MKSILFFLIYWSAVFTSNKNGIVWNKIFPANKSNLYVKLDLFLFENRQKEEILKIIMIFIRISNLN